MKKHHTKTYQSVKIPLKKRRKKNKPYLPIILSVIALVLVIVLIIQISGKEGPTMNEFNADAQIMVIEMENGDLIKVELYPDEAPITVNNFVTLVSEGFYDGLVFHRVIPGFMIQGGDGTTAGRQAKTIKGEFLDNGVENNLQHLRGVLSMARTSNKNSASSQFFIMHGDASHLDGAYAAFGKVIEGMEVVDRIANVECDTSDPNFPVPLTPQIIQRITIESRE
jgi:peptidyl-prolyl cis-trans isomerase B (cyclophilin B)